MTLPGRRSQGGWAQRNEGSLVKRTGEEVEVGRVAFDRTG